MSVAGDGSEAQEEGLHVHLLTCVMRFSSTGQNEEVAAWRPPTPSGPLTSNRQNFNSHALALMITVSSIFKPLVTKPTFKHLQVLVTNRFLGDLHSM